jgi:hypothetical protein
MSKIGGMNNPTIESTNINSNTRTNKKSIITSNTPESFPNNSDNLDLEKFLDNNLETSKNVDSSSSEEQKITKKILEHLFRLVGNDLDSKILPYVTLLYVNFEKLKKIAPLEYTPEIKEIIGGKDNIDLMMVNGIFGVGSIKNYIIQLVYQTYLHKIFDKSQIEEVTNDNKELMSYVDVNYIFNKLLRKYPEKEKSFDFPIEQLIYVLQNDLNN